MDATRARVLGRATCFLAFATGGRPRERWVVIWREGDEMMAESVLDRWAAEPELSLTDEEAWCAKAQMRGESGLTMEEMADWISGLRDERLADDRSGVGGVVAAVIATAVMAASATAIALWACVAVMRMLF